MEIFSFSAEILSRRGLTHHGWGWLAQSWGSLLLTDRESWMPAMLCLGSVVWDYLESSVRTVTLSRYPSVRV